MQYNAYLSDEKLVRQIQKGDLSALEILMKRYQSKATMVVYWLCRGWMLAEEAADEAFFSLYTHIEAIDPKKKFSSYMFVVVKNAVLSLLRKRHMTIPITDIAEIEDDIDIISMTKYKEEAKRLRETVCQLEQKYRKVIKLNYFDELSYEGISKRLRIPKNTIRIHLKRVKKILKELLHE